jgi:hypothetical protein
MTETKQIPRGQWKDYFDGFTRRFLRDDQPESVRLEIVSAALGDQVEAQTARLYGVSYDSRSQALEVLLGDMDHLVFHPKEIWVEEAEDGFLPSIQITRDEGIKEILTVRRVTPSGLDVFREGAGARSS